MIQDQLNDYELMELLYRVTGNVYSFATAQGRYLGSEEQFTREGTTYQLMPETTDNGFFDWYCDKRPYNQFFPSKNDCVLNFLKYWHIWKHKWQTQ
jgi:hypothetical protein